MARFTRIEIDALRRAIGEIEAGDALEFFLGWSCADEEARHSKEQRAEIQKAQRLVAALDRAHTKLVQDEQRADRLALMRRLVRSAAKHDSRTLTRRK